MKRFALLLVVLATVLPAMAAEDEEQLAELTRQKLETVILPNLDIKNEPLRTALWKIRNMTMVMSQDGKSGVEFVMKASDKVRNDTTVTVVMDSPTLGDALEEIGRQAHLMVVPMARAIALEEVDAVPTATATASATAGQ